LQKTAFETIGLELHAARLKSKDNLPTVSDGNLALLILIIINQKPVLRLLLSKTGF